MADGSSCKALPVSVVITTHGRREALLATLRELGAQTLAPSDFEVIVVDDGSDDGTMEALRSLSPPYRLVPLEAPPNSGISAKRNLGIRQAQGELLVLLSDDLLVPPDFLTKHLETHRTHSGCWVVGGFRQLPTITETPFGRYLDRMERQFDDHRKRTQIGDDLWELNGLTARNLSLLRVDLAATGLFDEQFRDACEDVDLAMRAREVGIRFVYNGAIDSLHNDQLGDLARFCRAQIPRTRDTVLFCEKHRAWYETNGDAAVERANRPISLSDPLRLMVKKAVRGAFASAWGMPIAEAMVALAERLRVPERLLSRMYATLIGLYMLRGWRVGMEVVRSRSGSVPSSTRSCETI